MKLMFRTLRSRTSEGEGKKGLPFQLWVIFDRSAGQQACPHDHRSRQARRGINVAGQKLIVHYRQAVQHHRQCTRWRGRRKYDGCKIYEIAPKAPPERVDGLA
jgi:hypothetical protein